jgi:conjugal transfer/type IV secretion protein DotA/TraY
MDLWCVVLMNSKNLSKYLGRALLSCLLCLVFSSVYAADNVADEMEKTNVNAVIAATDVKVPENYFSGPKEGDLALEMFRQLLGDSVYKVTKFNTNDLSSKATSTDVTLITYMLATMSTIGMIVGMFLTGYWLLVGLIKQNVEGEFMGKKWDSTMVPLRTVGSMIGMQPYPGFGGISFVQVGVLAIILLGVGAGSAVLSTGARFTYQNPQTGSQRPDYTGYVKNMFNSKICYEFLLARDDAQVGNDLRMRIESGQVLNSTHTSAINSSYKTQRYLIGENGICGDFAYHIESNWETKYGALASKEKKLLQIAINSQLKGPITQLWSDLDQVVKPTNGINLVNVNSINDLSNDDLQARLVALENAERNFKQTVNSAVDTAIAAQVNTEEQQKFFSMVEELGFAYAGSLHYPLLVRARVINTTIATFLVQPSQNISSIYNKFFSFNSYLEDYEKLQLQTDAMMNMWIKNKKTFDHIGATEIISRMQMGTSLEQYSDAFNIGLSKYLVNFFRDVEGQPDPMSEVSRIGQGLESLGVILLILNSHVSGISEAGGAVPFVSSLKGIAAPFIHILTVMTSVVFGLGVFYAEVLPSVPYIMWQIAIMGYFIYCLCLLYASPLWFAMFAHPDGDTAMGRAASGFPMLVTVLLKPSLMVMGLFTGMGLLKVMGWFIDVTFWPTISAINSDGGFVIFQFVGKLVIYGLIMGIAIYKANTLTWELPSLVNAMMGLNNTHQDLGEGEAHNKTLMVGGILSSNASTIVSGAGNKPTPTPTKSNEPKKDGEE